MSLCYYYKITISIRLTCVECMGLILASGYLLLQIAWGSDDAYPIKNFAENTYGGIPKLDKPDTCIYYIYLV